MSAHWLIWGNVLTNHSPQSIDFPYTRTCSLSVKHLKPETISEVTHPLLTQGIAVFWTVGEGDLLSNDGPLLWGRKEGMRKEHVCPWSCTPLASAVQNTEMKFYNMVWLPMNLCFSDTSRTQAMAVVWSGKFLLSRQGLFLCLFFAGFQNCEQYLRQTWKLLTMYLLNKVVS